MAVPSTEVRRIVGALDLTAGAFIVTLFGDVVEPRGGRLATASVIEACAAVGLNATQVRTAISRLVTAGRLEGAKEGRRSHYRLSEAAREEFRRASEAIYAPRRAAGFAFFWTPTAGEGEAAGARRLGPEFWVAPQGRAPDGCLTFAAPAPAAPSLFAFARSLWPLDALAASYADFMRAFSPLREAPLAGDALTLRLLLVHRFRADALRDPLLPLAALPPNWSGHVARRLFATLYLALSRSAEVAIAERLHDGASPLPATTSASHARAAALRLQVADVVEASCDATLG